MVRYAEEVLITVSDPLFALATRKWIIFSDTSIVDICELEEYRVENDFEGRARFLSIIDGTNILL